MKDLIILFILIAIIGGASLYIYKKKKAGVRCIGCPCSGSCSSSCSGSCSKKFH